MRAVVLRSLGVIAAGGLALAGVLYVASTVDARPPAVLEVRLTAPVGDDERLALITTSIEIAFSEPVATEGAEDLVRLEPAVPGAVSWSGSTMIFTPHDPLKLETAYRLVLREGLRDRAGNVMTQPPPPFEFRTAGRPTLAASQPEDGAEEVALDAPISLSFSTLMDIPSVEAELRVSPDFDHELRWRGEVLEIVPDEPLDPGTEYEVSIGAEAADSAGVTLGDAISVAFRTLSPGLAIRTLVPADGVEGIAPISPIAIVFDRPIDPGSLTDDMLTITPELAGTLEVAALPDDPTDDDGAGSLLRFTPSAPMPANTTFEVELTASPTTPDGGALGEPRSWSFTTGAPPAAISNGIAFLSARAGIPNVWVMNADGTAQRQVSGELTPVVDYAVAPDGSSLVVSDGRRLVYQRADGDDRRILTDEGDLEFDPAYAPDGQRVAFARADAESGEGLGLWEWSVGGGDAVAIELPESGVGPGASPAGPPAAALRAPRYAPDGQALAFVDLAGWVGIVELPAERLTRIPFVAGTAPMWLPDASAVVVTGTTDAGALADEAFDAPVLPLEPGSGDAVHRLARSGTAADPLRLARGSVALAVAGDGSLAYADGAGRLRTLPRATATPEGRPLTEEQVGGAAFSPGGDMLVIALSGGDGEGHGPLELLDLAGGERTPLAPDGARPRWLP